MNLASLAQTINDTPVGTAIREAGTLFPWIESTHVLMAVIVVGSIAIVDLRLIGVAAHRRGARQLILDLLPFTWMAFVGAVITGSLLFTSNAIGYIDSKPFLFKMVVLVLAGINMAVFHLTAYRRIGDWDETMPTPPAARISGILSLTLWIVVVFLGRWIGFSAPFV
jgi:hypothetical protein